MPVRVQLQSVQPAMRLARPIFDGEGRLVAGAGTRLQDAVVRVLRHMAVQSVVVVDGGGSPTWDTVRPLERELADLDARFGGAPTTEPLVALHGAIARRLTARAARHAGDEIPVPVEPAPPIVAAGVAPAPPAPDALRRQLARLRSVPTLPSMLERVVRALEDPDVDFDAVGEVIEVDQALTSQILRLANSAFYSVAGRVSRVSQALVVLGAVVARSVLLSTTVLDLRRVPLRGFWEHSLGCAVAAGAIAKVTGRAQPEEVTAAGLLHDLGKVIVCKELPEVFEWTVGRATAERRALRLVEHDLLEVDHGEIASWLVARWRFPACLAEPIAFHHEPGRATSAPDETAMVHVANSLVRGLGYGFGGDPLVPPIAAAAWARLGLTPSRLDDVLACWDADLDRALNYAVFD